MKIFQCSWVGWTVYVLTDGPIESIGMMIRHPSLSIQIPKPGHPHVSGRLCSDCGVRRVVEGGRCAICHSDITEDIIGYPED